MLRLQVRPPFARRGALVAAMAVSTLLVSTAAAQATPASTAAPDSSELIAPLLGTDAIAPRWAALRVAEDGSDGERSAWEQLRAVRLETGVRNLPLHSAALVVDAADALGRGDRRRATELLAWASELDPDGSEARFIEARAHLAMDPLGLPTALQIAIDGWQRRLATAAGRQAFAVATATVATLAAAVFAALVVVFVAARRIGQLAFDVRLLLLRGPSLTQTNVLVALGLAVLAMTVGSPLLLVAALIAVAAPYVGVQERLAMLLACGALAVVPVVALEGLRSWSADAARVDRIALAPLSVCDADCEEDLTAEADAGNADATLALAWVRFRVADSAALADIDAMLASARERGADPAATACLAGALSYANGDMTGAERHWREVLGTASGPDTRAAAAINLARRLQLAGDRLGSTQAFELAEHLSPRLAAQYRTYAGRSRNRVLAACAPDIDHAWEQARAEVDPQQLAILSAPFRAHWYGRAAPEQVRPLPAALAVWIAFSALLGRLGVVNGRCRQCGTPTSRLVYRRAWLDRTCIACYQLAVVAPQLTFAQRHARERRIDVRRARLRTWTAIAGLVVPGGGLLGRGHAVPGVALLAPACLAGVVLAMRSDLPAAADWIQPALGLDGVRFGALGLLAICWGVSVAVELLVLWTSR